MSEHSRRRNKRARRSSDRTQTSIASGARKRSLRGDSPVRVPQMKAFEEVEADAISLTPEPNRSQVIAEPLEGFRIEVLNSDGFTWDPHSACLPHAKSHKAEAEKLARTLPGKRAVRVCKPGATRAVYRFN